MSPSWRGAAHAAVCAALIGIEAHSPPASLAPAAPSRLSLAEGFIELLDGSAEARLRGWSARVAPDGRVTVATRAGELELESDLARPRTLAVDAATDTVRLDRGVAVEEWSLVGDALEQRWRFAAPPATSELDVRVLLRGASPRPTPSGVSLDVGGSAFALSDATWVDAAGRRTAVRAQLAQGAVRYTVPAAVLASTRWPAVLDPTLAPEQPLSNDTVDVEAVSSQLVPQVAILGSTALVVWQDSRRALTLGAVGNSDIFGALVNIAPVNRPNVTRRFAIAVSPDAKTLPVVAAGSTSFFVAWQSASPSKLDTDVFGALIPQAGPTGRPEVLPLGVTATNEATPAVGYSAAEDKFLVVYDSNQYTGPIRGVRVNATTGAVATGFQVSVSANGTTFPRVAWAGSTWVVIWIDTPVSANAGVGFARYAMNATTATSSGFVASGTTANKRDADVIGGPNEHLVLWVDLRSGNGNYEMYGTVINSNGTQSSTTGVAMRTGETVWNPHGSYAPIGVPPSYGVVFFSQPPTSPSPPSHFTLEWYNTGTLALWNSSTMYISTFGPGFNSGDGIALNSSSQGVVAISDGTDVFLYTASPGILNTPPAVVSAWPAQEQARVTQAGGQVLVSWPQFNGVDGGYDVLARRMSFDGGSSDPSPIAVVSGGLSPPVVQSSGGVAEHLIEYFAFVPDGGVSLDVYATRVTNAGSVGPTVSIANSGSNESAAAAVFDGTNHHAMYYVHLGSGSRTPFTIAAKRISPAGAVVDAMPFAVMTPGASLKNASAAANDAGIIFVAVEQDAFGPVQLLWTAMLAGNVTDGGRLLTGDGGFPSVASNGRDFLLVWEGYNGATAPDLYGQRFAPTGAALDPSPVGLEVGASKPERPNVTFNGGQYFLSWHERGSDGGYDVKGRWLSQTLQPLNNVVIASPYDDVAPHAVSDGKGTSLLSFIRIQDEDSASVPRIFTTIVSAGQLADTCTSDTQCLSGHCANSVCCDSACTGTCQTCLASAGAAANGSCGPKTPGTQCRMKASDCDAPEACDGVNAACPADAPADAGTVCRMPSEGCDVAETCDGTGFNCPPDGFAPVDTVCSSTALPCALPGKCDGGSPVCPAAGVQLADTVCRGADGGCDVPEKCDGVNQTCPPDGFAHSDVVCRGKAQDSPCDVEEKCTGNSVDCPPDGFADSTTSCRMAMTSCDVTEFCSGSGPKCPGDAFQPSTTVCSAPPTDNECEDVGTCTGGSPSCGANPPRPDGTSCQGGAGACKAGSCVTLEHSRYGWKGCGCGAGAGLLPMLALLVLRRRRRGGLLLLVTGLLLATPALAEPQKLKLVFTGIAGGAGVSDETARSVAEYVQSELSRIDAYRVVSPGDLAAVLGVERQKQLLGCQDASGSCLAELAGALDADRLLRGEMSRIDETIVLNLSIVDLRKSEQVGRIARRVESGGVSAALREVQPMLYELLNQTPEHKAKPLVLEQGFAAVTVGLRGEGDVFARGIAPAVFAELAGKYFGGALTVIATTTPGGRLEGRFYPKTFPIARPYLSLGGIVFTTGLGVHAGAGIAVRFSHLVLSFDASYERFLVDFQKGYSPNSVVLALGAGWAF